MNRAAAEEYVASLYATILRRDPLPDELAHWANAATTWPAEQIYFAFVNSGEYQRQQKVLAPVIRLPDSDFPRFGRALSLGDGVSGEMFGPGWSSDEDGCRWMTGGSSVLIVPMPRDHVGDFILLLRVQPFTADGQIDCQHCTVICGAETVAEVNLAVPSWIGFRVPAGAVVSDKLWILFVHPDARSPRELGNGSDSRELAIAVHEAGLLPVTEADERTGWRGGTGEFVSSDWRAQAEAPDWKKIALNFQSMGQNCEFGLVQRRCEAEPLGLFRWCNISSHTLIQCLRSEFSEILDEEKLIITPWNDGEYVGRFGDYENFDLLYHTWIRIDQNPDVDAVHRNESTRLKMMVRLFKDDLDDGEKIFVLLRKDFLKKEALLGEFEVLPIISLMRRYNPNATLLWVTIANPDETHLIGQCEIIGNNLLKGYIDKFGTPDDLTSTLSLAIWKDIMASAMQALGRTIPTQPQCRG